MFKPSKGDYVKKISFEMLNNQRQGLEISKLAELVGWPEKHPGELQNYLNHGQYLDGWSYNGNGIGTSVILADTDRKNPFENYERFSRDNNVLAFSKAISGQNLNGNYHLKIGTIKSNCLAAGNKQNPLKQFTTQLSYHCPLNIYGLDSFFDLGFDQGDLYGSQIGLNLGLRKRWN